MYRSLSISLSEFPKLSLHARTLFKCETTWHQNNVYARSQLQATQNCMRGVCCTGEALAGLRGHAWVCSNQPHACEEHLILWRGGKLRLNSFGLQDSLFVAPLSIQRASLKSWVDPRDLNMPGQPQQKQTLTHYGNVRFGLLSTRHESISFRTCQCIILCIF